MGLKDVWTRQYLKDKYSNIGLKDEDIGFQDGMVSIKGKGVIRPSSVEGGKSYADPTSMDADMEKYQIQNGMIPQGGGIARDIINENGARFGIDNSKIGYRINPNTGMNQVTVGGDVIGEGWIDPTGRTIMNADKLRGSIEKYGTDNKLTDLNKLEQPPAEYKSPYEDKINALADKILGMGKFEYNPETDPKFQALKGLYEKQGNLAAEDNIGSLSAATGGRLNSWAASAASQAQNAYNEKLMGLVPGMYQNAYSEYQGDINREYSNMDMLTNRDTTGYNRYRDGVDDQSNLRDHIEGKYNSNRTYNEGVRQYDASRGDQNSQFAQNFDETKRVNDRSFGEGVRQYDASRGDQINQSERTFNEGVRVNDRNFTEDVRQNDRTFEETVTNNKNTRTDRNNQFEATQKLSQSEFDAKYNPDSKFYQAAKDKETKKDAKGGAVYDLLFGGVDPETGEPATPEQNFEKYRTSFGEDFDYALKLYNNYIKEKGSGDALDKFLNQGE